MFLKEKASPHLVELLDTAMLFDPFQNTVTGRYNYGEELPEMEIFSKSDLEFMSGEALPRCWLDPQYRSHANVA